MTFASTSSTLAEDTLVNWLQFYNDNRRAGHTTAAISAVKAAGEDARLVCANFSQASSLKQQHGIKTFSLFENDALRGFSRVPLVWDNYAVTAIFSLAHHRINDLLNSLYVAEKQRNATRNDLDAANRTIAELRAELEKRKTLARKHGKRKIAKTKPAAKRQ